MSQNKRGPLYVSADEIDGPSEEEAPQAPLGVGSTIWIFDENHRVYAEPPKKGNLWPSVAPIWRKHWRPTVIMGETSRSWIMGPYSYSRRIGKKELREGKVFGVLTSEADVDAACFVHDHAYKIGERVQRLSGGIQAAEVLRQIARLVGYEVPS